ncbi:MAG: cation:dicarboxylase symporter family transporter [Rhabdochlamydiaceae bacterium]|jgi:proton glutamate symport protein
MKISLGYQVIIAIVLGIITGLFFGSRCAVLDPIGEIFFMLLQMVVLPYLLFLLMHGLGTLSKSIARKLFQCGWAFFIVIWIAGFAVVYALLYLIPTLQLVFVEPIASGTRALTMDLLTYLIPRNVFYALSNNIVPAITICGLIAGLAIMSIEKKDYVLNFLSQANTSIEKILEWLAIVSPLAIFSHVAVAAGTLKFENLAKVEIYVVIFIVAVLFLTFWFLPALLTSLTDFSYKEVVKEFRMVCLVPFATAMPSLAFPFIYQTIKRLSRRNGLENEQFYNTSQTILPLAFTFGQLGNFFILFFIYFLSYYTHHALTSTEEFTLMVLLLPLSFGTVISSVSSVSFLIDKFHFPQEAYHIFWTTASIMMNFQVLLSVASVLTLIILIISAYYGLLKVKWKKLILNLAIAFGVFGCLVISIKPFLTFEDNFTNLYRGLRISNVIDSPPKTTVYRPGQPIPPSAYPSLLPLERILKSGVLRIGYFFMDTPFCYFNSFGEIAGYDIAFAYQLAKDLGCSLEFIPIETDRMGEQLSKGEYDVAMSAVVMTELRLTQMDFVKPTFEQNNVLVVPVHKRNEYLNLDAVVAKKGLKIGGFGAYYDTMPRHFPLAQCILTQNFNSFIDGEIDAIFWTYLSAFVWCLSHPEFTIIDYQGRLGKRFISYAVAETSYEIGRFLQNWLILKNESGFTKKIYDYWILGQLPEDKSVRWSILQNVFQDETSP